MQMQTIKTFEEMERGNKRVSINPDKNSSDDFKKKIEETKKFIKECIEASSNPICLTSFGKDSLVMLHLILSVKKVPVIYWREPYYQKKFKHPQEIAEKWDLTVYDYPPSFVDYYQNEDYFDVYNFYDTGNNSKMNLYTGCQKREEGEFLCGIKDLLLRPTVPSYDFQWDCIFHGHKQSDPVYIADKIELPKVKIFGNGIMALPIVDWTDEDIWRYIQEFDLPYNAERYDDINEDRNNDVFPTCFKCLDYRNTGEVACPKTGKEVKCVGKSKEQNKAFKEQLLGVAYK